MATEYDLESDLKSDSELEPQPQKKNRAKALRSVRLSAMNMLARREHSHQELFTKLNQKFNKIDVDHGIDIDIIEQVLHVLKEEHLQDDLRFAEAFVRFRSQKGQGPLRIREELKQKGVAEHITEQVIYNADIDWQSIAKTLYQKKYQGKPVADNNDRAKRQRFMQYRGFNYEHFDF